MTTSPLHIKARFGGLFLALKRYARFEWYGWRFYRKHGEAVTARTWYQGLEPVRVLLAGISFSLGIFFIWPGDIFRNPGYYFLRQWISEDVFGACFVLHGIGLVWRIYAPSRINAWSRFFGALGVSLYTFYPLAIGFGLGHERGQFFVVTGQGVALLWLAWACAWCARRVGNGEDRSGA